MSSKFEGAGHSEAGPNHPHLHQRLSSNAIDVPVLIQDNSQHFNHIINDLCVAAVTSAGAWDTVVFQAIRQQRQATVSVLTIQLLMLSKRLDSKF